MFHQRSVQPTACISAKTGGWRKRCTAECKIASISPVLGHSRFERLACHTGIAPANWGGINVLTEAVPA
ncbi:MAG: hypothetical protein MUC60_05005 [Oscillatoria sp. Prado101]|nr:hypothetical protein [Oscillatoria sp. Prado101]